MAVETKTLKAKASVKKDTIVLTANLSDLELEDLRVQGGRIELSVQVLPIRLILTSRRQKRTAKSRNAS
jgi:hypothetical protein